MLREKKLFYKPTSGSIVTGSCSALCYEPDGTHLTAVSSVAHLGRLSIDQV